MTTGQITAIIAGVAVLITAGIYLESMVRSSRATKAAERKRRRQKR